ncbi:MAG: hypothetical protein U9Q73_02465 [Nanoarchaeota archaeon]|nr:hypothetical protein [Nanoarchaeota archaeon]
MKLLKNEKELSKHASLIITNYRLIQEKKSLGKRTHKEIPLEKIDSISFEYNIRIGMIILGIILMFTGLFWNYSKIYSPQIGFLMIISGIVVLMISLLLRKELVEFNSSTLKISEEIRDIEKFIDIVRGEIYKK